MGPVTVTAARIYKGESSLPPSPARWSARSAPTFPCSCCLRRPHQDLFAGWPDHRQRPVHGRLHDRREDAQRGHFHVVRHGGRGRRAAIRLGRRQHLPPTNGTPAQTLLELAKAKGRAVGAVSTTRVGHATPATTYAHVCNRNGYNTIAEQSTPGHAELQHPAWRRHRRAAGRRTAQLSARRSTRPASAPTASSGDGLPGQGYTYVDTGTALRALNPAPPASCWACSRKARWPMNWTASSRPWAMTSPAWPR